jgi:hypothetical protein
LILGMLLNISGIVLLGRGWPRFVLAGVGLGLIGFVLLRLFQQR